MMKGSRPRSVNQMKYEKNFQRIFGVKLVKCPSCGGMDDYWDCCWRCGEPVCNNCGDLSFNICGDCELEHYAEKEE